MLKLWTLSAVFHDTIPCLSSSLKLFQCCTIFDSPLPQTLWIFWLNVIFSPLSEYLLFFWCRCIMFTVRGVPVLRVQKLQEIETVNDFGWEVWWVNVTQMSCFCKENLVFCPPSQYHFIPLSINLYLNSDISFKCIWKVLEWTVQLIWRDLTEHSITCVVKSTKSCLQNTNIWISL